MENSSAKYDTLTGALEQLKTKGYTHDFSIRPGEDCLVCNSSSVSLSPEDFKIDEVIRFEGQTDPDDEMILFAISSDKFGVKGFLLNAYSIYADEINSRIVEKLTKRTESKKVPIKRHPALVQFSRDHHFGLLLVWKIRQGLKSNIATERISNYLLYFFEQDLLPHFKKEEEDMFTKLPEDDNILTKALNDHKRIYSLVNLIGTDKSNPNLLSEFADTLDQHIRFEERTLFNHLQNTLTEIDLTALALLHPEQKEDADINWNDHFWTHK